MPGPAFLRSPIRPTLSSGIDIESDIGNEYLNSHKHEIDEIKKMDIHLMLQTGITAL